MEGLQVSEIFKIMERNKIKLMISDWGISQSSLEDVFMNIIESS